MTRNLEGMHRVVRIVIGLALLAIAILDGGFGTQNLVIGVVGVVLLASARVSYHPLYALLGCLTGRPTDNTT